MHKTRLFHIVIVALSFLVFGCSTIDPYTGEQKTSHATKGAGIGALSGALLGAATSSKGDRKKAVVTGAVVGGAVGGGIGYYMDVQEAKLRQYLQGTGVQVRREGNNIRLIMPGNITFSTGRAEIKSSFYEVLNSVSLVLKEYAKTSIRIAGHTDSIGTESSNQTLSERRAESVSSYLRSRGISAGRIQATGYGERYPIASNINEAGRSQNRRVELELIPL